MLSAEQLALAIQQNVTAALAEDIATGDLTAALIPADKIATAYVLSREKAICCGREWFDACFRKLDPEVKINWFTQDGQCIGVDQMLCEITGNARALLSAERPALNFLQTLSATATAAHQYAQAIKDTSAVIMDTRKTLPGLRIAQKYAVSCGGGKNQRVGLFDGILIKENHIAAAGSIAAVLKATRNASVPVQIEVENLDELKQALNSGAKLILLDNFNITELIAAVALTQGRAILEASGNVDLNNVRAIAETGVQRISTGSITKHIHAVDLSMRIDT
ncbi:carboxylating nicotinate-nucleotide diphosphorylase [Sulfuriferula nivalis]|uniref:Probable nicotinate-nucleotide pyrophosphorylase [carboxylating] n=1 Tax=Sulfuriferula nivalis TaxID=2675298 RepID=A0A809RI37_9PROT|nr:carboxylating nicotinate-nucleotide diphosphorylase [Sulfuriferula nivalis]BBP01185.1 nicotinate-nucleotide diphosphorylase (carboxylating) [Sulfuriferula nivalis]